MKRLITSAVALTLLAGAPALAQDRDKHDGRHDNGGQHHQQATPRPNNAGGGHQDRDRGDANRNPNAGRDNTGGRGNPGVNRDRPNNPGRDVNRNDNRGNPNWNRNDNRNPNWNRNDNRNPNWNRNDNRGNPNWNNNRNVHNGRWNGQRPRNFDRRVYQRNIRAARRFHTGYYRRPPGWYYRRWTYGQILPFAFFSSTYYLNDWYDFGLPVPPYGYEWVRYGDDAILVDVRTGMILQVVYGIFY